MTSHFSRAAFAAVFGLALACAPTEDEPEILDQDFDGILDDNDLCPLHVDEPMPDDQDLDGRWASCDDDDDGDGRLDGVDPTPLDPVLVDGTIDGGTGGSLVVSGVFAEDPYEGMSVTVPPGAFTGSRTLSVSGLDGREIDSARSPGVTLGGGFENATLILPAQLTAGETVVLRDLQAATDITPDDADPMGAAVLVSGLGDGTYVVVAVP